MCCPHIVQSVSFSVTIWYNYLSGACPSLSRFTACSDAGCGVMTSAVSSPMVQSLTCPSRPRYPLPTRPIPPSSRSIPRLLHACNLRQRRRQALLPRQAHIPPRNRRPPSNRQLLLQPTPLPPPRSPLLHPHLELPQPLRRRRSPHLF